MNRNFARWAASAALALGAGTAGAAVVSNFEGGTVDGWKNTDPSLTMTVVPGGSQGSNFALRVDRTAGGWNQAMNTVLSPAQWADVASGTTLTVDVKALGGPGNDIPGWWLELFPTVNSENGGWVNGSKTAITLDGQWHTYTVTYAAQPAAPGGWSELFLINQGGDGTNTTGTNMTFYLDNVVVGASPVPEPASLALLGVAGLALARRRRRV